jgi:hypothetical protein
VTVSHKIRFFFRTRTGNSPLFDLISRLISSSSLPHQLDYSTGEISLLAEGSAEELAALADQLGREVPLSIFLEESGITAVTPETLVAQARADDIAPFPDRAGINELPPCPRCLLRAEADYLRGQSLPADNCNLCGGAGRQGLRLELDSPGGKLRLARIAPPDQPASQPAAAWFGILAQAAQLLAAGRRLDISLPGEQFLAAAVAPQNLDTGAPAKPSREADRDTSAAQASEPDYPTAISEVLVTIPETLPEYWHCGEDELLLLAALEKPLLLLEPSPENQQRYQLAPRPLPVGLAADLFFWHLGRHLRALDIPLLFLANRSETPRCRPLMLADRQNRWLLTGHRAVLPLLVPLNFGPDLQPGAAHGPVTVSIHQHPTAATPKTAASPALLLTRSTTRPADVEPSGPVNPRQVFRAFLATSTASNLSRTELATTGPGSIFGISLYPYPNGLTLLELAPDQEIKILVAPDVSRPQHPSAILAELAELDDQARRLVANFATHHPDRWQRLQTWPTPIRIDNPADLWLLLLLIGGEEQENTPLPDGTTSLDCTGFPPAESGPIAHFLRLAALVNPGRSPRLEMAANHDPWRLDERRVLRSALSYAVGGVGSAALCRGWLESLAEWLSRIIWEQAGPDSTPRVALCSKLCLHPAFFNAIRNQGREDFLLPPPPLPLDCLPAIGRLWDASQADPGADPATQRAVANDDRRAALKSAFGLFGGKAGARRG